MNIFVEVLAALAVTSLLLQVFLLTPCLLESGSRETEFHPTPPPPTPKEKKPSQLQRKT